MNTQMTCSDRFRPVVPEDDNYDHDLDDPEFYHYSEETEHDEYSMDEYEPDQDDGWDD